MKHHWMRFGRRLRLAWQALRYGSPDEARLADWPALDAEDLEDIRRFFPRAKFFILGHARSGTTLLLRLVRLHPEVHASYQAHFFTRPPGLHSMLAPAGVQDWLAHRANRWNHGRNMGPAMLRAAADFVMEREAAVAGARIVGDKSPTSVWHGEAVERMAALYPDARLVYIIRDGRDVLLSERFRNLVEERDLTPEDRLLLSRLAQDPAPFVSGQASIFTADFVRHMAARWAADVREVDEAARRLYGERYFVVRYEDLLARPFHWMCQIWEFLGVENLPNDLAEQVAAEMQSNPDQRWQHERNPALAGVLERGRQGNWRQFFTPADRRLFAQIANDALIRWGYEKDASWVQEENTV